MVVPRLKELYEKEIVSRIKEQMKYDNALQVPRLEKVVLNIGLSEAKENIKVIDAMTADFMAMTGQKPQVTRAKKSISNFKLRAGVPIGLKVTLRGSMMYEFLDRFITAATPRIRDFNGLPTTGFDGKGNYNVGIKEHHIFPEVDLTKSDKARGLNITICTTANEDEPARLLLEFLGIPFKKIKKKVEKIEK
ncbi:MAG: 50S ribosomal protein L5 [Elusimicrobiota bacterium]